MSRPFKYNTFSVVGVITTSRAYTEQEMHNLLDKLGEPHRENISAKGTVIGLNRKTNTKLRHER